jgi:hypothetical protein
MSGDDVARGFEASQFIISADHLGIDLAVERIECGCGGTFKQDFAVSDDGHARAELADVFDDVGGKDDGDIGADRAEEIEKAVALGGIEASGGLVDDDELRIGEQRLGDAEALFHAAGVGAESFLARGPEIGLIEESIDHLVALSLIGDSFHNGEMLQHVEGGHLGINPELLGEITQYAADGGFVLEDVDAVEMDRAGVWILQGRNGAHEGGLTRTVRPRRPNISLPMVRERFLRALTPLG